MTTSTDDLSPEDIEFFDREGYLVFEDFIEPDLNQRLMADVDAMIEDRQNETQRRLIDYPELGLLTSHPPMMGKIESVMNSTFAMHHIHATRHDAGSGGVAWHQDYAQLPHTNRSHAMVHIFYYLNGLNGEIGDLLFVPGSQKSIVSDGALQIMGDGDLPGMVCVDTLPSGSAIMVHSALWHARRAKPGGEDMPRYFIDVSYCQNGVTWPGYGSHKAINARALELGLDREGRYAHVYDSSTFFDAHEYRSDFDTRNQGSLVLQLKDL